MRAALSAIDRYCLPISVGVVPEPASNWPGFWMPTLSYLKRQVTLGLPPRPVSKRYCALSVTT